MTSATPLPTHNTADIAATAEAAARTTGAGDDPFARLLAKRRRYGRLAELSRSHHSQSVTTQCLDDLVDALTDALETRHPQQWEAVIDEVYADEAAFLHLPFEHDPTRPHDKRPPVFLACKLCRELATTVVLSPTPTGADAVDGPANPASRGQRAATARTRPATRSQSSQSSHTPTEQEAS